MHKIPSGDSCWFILLETFILLKRLLCKSFLFGDLKFILMLGWRMGPIVSLDSSIMSTSCVPNSLKWCIIMGLLESRIIVCVYTYIYIGVYLGSIIKKRKEYDLYYIVIDFDVWRLHRISYFFFKSLIVESVTIINPPLSITHWIFRNLLHGLIFVYAI